MFERLRFIRARHEREARADRTWQAVLKYFDEKNKPREKQRARYRYELPSRETQPGPKRGWDAIPDTGIERIERVNSVEKEPRTYRVTGAPQRIEPPSYLERDHKDDQEEVRFALRVEVERQKPERDMIAWLIDAPQAHFDPKVEAERLQRERDRIYQSIDSRVRFDPKAEAAHRERERDEIDRSFDRQR